MSLFVWPSLILQRARTQSLSMLDLRHASQGTVTSA